MVAKDIFQPDFFLYENNKSAAPEIKEQIQSCLGGHLIHINSALVSAQNRERFYVTNEPVSQPQDRGIKLRDVLVAEREREREKTYCLDSLSHSMTTHTSDGCIRVGTIVNEAKTKAFDSAPYRVYSPEGKSVTLLGKAGGVGAKTGLYFAPLSERELDYMLRRQKDGRSHFDFRYHSDATKDKSSCLTANIHKGVPYNVLVDQAGAYENLPVYQVKEGKLLFKDVWHEVPMKDGMYIIRKLLPVECERLQTLPDGYTEGVSNTQRYKCLGNGWTAEVIIHILSQLLRDVPREEDLLVLSMYDGIATGRYCLERLGFTSVTYHAYEIDPYAIKVANKNYPDIIQHGDAFDIQHLKL